MLLGSVFAKWLIAVKIIFFSKLNEIFRMFKLAFSAEC